MGTAIAVYIAVWAADTAAWKQVLAALVFSARLKEHALRRQPESADARLAVGRFASIDAVVRALCRGCSGRLGGDPIRGREKAAPVG